MRFASRLPSSASRIEVFDLGGEPRGKVGGVERRDGSHTALAGNEPAPEFIPGISQGRHRAQAGDDDTSLVQNVPWLRRV